jgi:hypothetical protein
MDDCSCKNINKMALSTLRRGCLAVPVAKGVQCVSDNKNGDVGKPIISKMFQKYLNNN